MGRIGKSIKDPFSRVLLARSDLTPARPCNIYIIHLSLFVVVSRLPFPFLSGILVACLHPGRAIEFAGQEKNKELGTIGYYIIFDTKTPV